MLVGNAVKLENNSLLVRIVMVIVMLVRMIANAVLLVSIVYW